MPSIKRIVDRRQEDTYLRRVFYPASELTRPSSGTAHVEITAIDSAGMRATISTTVPQTFVWSVPFTSNWRLRLNGEPRLPQSSPEGLTELFLEPGVSTVEFAYAPPYLAPCRWLRLLAILTLAFIAVRETLRLASPSQSSVVEHPHLSPVS